MQVIAGTYAELLELRAAIQQEMQAKLYEVDSKIAEIEADVMPRLQGGEVIKGFKLEYGSERRSITKPTELLSSLQKNFPDTEWTTTTMLSMTKIEKKLADMGLAKKDISKSMEKYVEYQQGKPKLELDLEG